MPNDPRAFPVDATEASPVDAKQLDSRAATRITQQVTGLPAGNGGASEITSPGADDPIKKDVLTTADLVKIFELTLGEHRSTQTIALSVLAASLACGPFIQKIKESTDPNAHDFEVAWLLWGESVTATTHGFDFAMLLWIVGVGVCMIGAFMLIATKAHIKPFEEFVDTSDSKNQESGLEKLKGALNKSLKLVRIAYVAKRIVMLGALCVVIAICIEVFEKYG